MKKKQSLQKAALQHLFAGYEKHGLSIKALFTELGYDAEDFEEASFRLPSEKLGKLVRLAAIKLNDETIPYDTADFRWIDYAANWRGYVEGMKAWQRPSAEPLKKQLASLADCRLPAQIRSLAIDSSDNYTSDGLLLLGKCSFKPQVRLSDDQIASHLRVRGWDGLVEEDIFEALWYTTLGIEGESWDFMNLIYSSFIFSMSNVPERS